MEKYLEVISLLIITFGVLTGILITISELDYIYNFKGVGFTIIGISLVTFGFLNGLAKIIILLKEINNIVSDKEWWGWKI